MARLPVKEVERRFKLCHGDKYEYAVNSKGDIKYKHSQQEIRVTCRACVNAGIRPKTFKVLPAIHWQGYDDDSAGNHGNCPNTNCAYKTDNLLRQFNEKFFGQAIGISVSYDKNKHPKVKAQCVASGHIQSKLWSGLLKTDTWHCKACNRNEYIDGINKAYKGVATFVRSFVDTTRPKDEQSRLIMKCSVCNSEVETTIKDGPDNFSCHNCAILKRFRQAETAVYRAALMAGNNNDKSKAIIRRVLAPTDIVIGESTYFVCTQCHRKYEETLSSFLKRPLLCHTCTRSKGKR